MTVRQLLSHTSGLPLIETGWPHCTWSDTLARIYRVRAIEPGSAYQPQSTWFLLGEILQRLDSGQRSFNTILTEDLLTPIGIGDVWCGLADDHATTLTGRPPEFTVTERGDLDTSDYSVEPWLTRPSPGVHLRGPIRELGRFYEMLLNKGVNPSGQTVLQSETVANMTSSHRTGMFDDTMQHVVDLGPGLFLDSNRYGENSVPYGFGKYCISRYVWPWRCAVRHGVLRSGPQACGRMGRQWSLPRAATSTSQSGDQRSDLRRSAPVHLNTCRLVECCGTREERGLGRLFS